MQLSALSNGHLSGLLSDKAELVNVHKSS